jgi:hypothetical protein
MVSSTGKGTVKGLASQKWTFGLREVAQLGVGETAAAIKSAAAKVSASPLTYKAPKADSANKPETIKGSGSTDFGWQAAAKPNGLTGTTSYEVGIWDAVKKEYLWFDASTLSIADVEIKKKTKATVSIDALPVGSDGGTLTTGQLDTKGKYVFGIREVVKDGGNVVAKSAVLKVNVTVK